MYRQNHQPRSLSTLRCWGAAVPATARVGAELPVVCDGRREQAHNVDSQQPVERLGQGLQLLGDALGFLRWPQPEPAWLWSWEDGGI